MLSFRQHISENQRIKLPILDQNDFEIYLKREDKIHPIISGNKYRKLKYNIEFLKNNNKKSLITFGGAYSNHLLACSYAGHINGFNTFGIIRGNELNDKELNSNLKKCKKYGMKFNFISRDEYRERNGEKYLKSIQKKFKDSIIIPEGGTNILGVKGCEEILNNTDKAFDVICCPVGTGSTISGIINSKNKNQLVLGFSALKSSKIKNVIAKFVNNKEWFVFDDLNFGGYAKVDKRLVNFINEVNINNGIILDPIYNSKMMFSVIDMIKKNKWHFGKKILLINTGGSSYVNDINLKLKKKGCLTIDY